MTQSVKRILEFTSFQDINIQQSTQATIHKAHASVEPLPLSSPLPSTLTRGYLEELRKRGAAFLGILAHAGREEGNVLFKQATTQSGDLQQRTRGEAARKYGVAGRVPDESGVAYCNAAAAHLLLKNYDMARTMAQEAVNANARTQRDVPTYSAKRAACVTAIATGTATTSLRPSRAQRQRPKSRQWLPLR